MIIAIDGPSGSGKSTISKMVAQKLDLTYIDTGAIYRTVGLICMEKELDPKNESDHKRIWAITENFPISFKFVDGFNHVFYGVDENKRDVSEAIRTPEASMMASNVSKLPFVRELLKGIQQDLGNSNDSILEGRDIGTVIFPKAEYKFFLTASDDVRAERRFKELQEKGTTTTLEEVKAKIIERDKQDSERETAPLKQADDAIAVDSSSLTISEVVEHIVTFVKDNPRG